MYASVRLADAGDRGDTGDRERLDEWFLGVAAFPTDHSKYDNSYS